MTALGLVETKGLLAAIEGADAMLKAAEVRLLEKNLVGGGLVTITVAGEVGAVQAAVNAAVAAIARIPGAVLVSRHVIPRPDEAVGNIIALKSPTAGKTVPAQPAAAPRPAPMSKSQAAPDQKAEAQAQSATPKAKEAAKPESSIGAPLDPAKPAATPAAAGDEKSSAPVQTKKAAKSAVKKSGKKSLKKR